ncbi:MAG: hypothetical protein GY730_09980 [bacterium]|nr:hypothetical protein [bacterium]
MRISAFNNRIIINRQIINNRDTNDKKSKTVSTSETKKKYLICGYLRENFTRGYHNRPCNYESSLETIILNYYPVLNRPSINEFSKTILNIKPSHPLLVRRSCVNHYSPGYKEKKIIHTSKTKAEHLVYGYLRTKIKVENRGNTYDYRSIMAPFILDYYFCGRFPSLSKFCENIANKNQINIILTHQQEKIFFCLKRSPVSENLPLYYYSLTLYPASMAQWARSYIDNIEVRFTNKQHIKMTDMPLSPDSVKEHENAFKKFLFQCDRHTFLPESKICCTIVYDAFKLIYSQNFMSDSENTDHNGADKIYTEFTWGDLNCDISNKNPFRKILEFLMYCKQ